MAEKSQDLVYLIGSEVLLALFQIANEAKAHSCPLCELDLCELHFFPFGPDKL